MTPVDSRQPPDPALIHLITGRYYEMRGLNTVADAVMPIHLGLVLAFFHAGASESLWLLVVMLIVPMAYWLWARYTWVRRRIDGFYAERCGRVTAVIGIEYKDFFTQGPMYVPILKQLGAPNWSLALVALAILSIHPLWIVRRDWPYRAHWLLPAVVGIVASMMLAGVRTKEDAFTWQAFVFLGGGMAMAIAGMLDHRLLVRTLRPATPHLAPEPEDP